MQHDVEIRFEERIAIPTWANALSNRATSSQKFSDLVKIIVAEVHDAGTELGNTATAITVAVFVLFSAWGVLSIGLLVWMLSLGFHWSLAFISLALLNAVVILVLVFSTLRFKVINHRVPVPETARLEMPHVPD